MFTLDNLPKQPDGFVEDRERWNTAIEAIAGEMKEKGYSFCCGWAHTDDGKFRTGIQIYYIGDCIPTIAVEITRASL